MCAHGAEKRTNGAEKITNGAENRTLLRCYGDLPRDSDPPADWRWVHIIFVMLTAPLIFNLSPNSKQGK